MAKRITQEQIAKMAELYEELGTYSAVAKKLGVSASSVSKYLKEQNSCKSFNTYSGPQPSQFPPDKEKVIGFGFLSQKEKDSYDEWLKEF